MVSDIDAAAAGFHVHRVLTGRDPDVVTLHGLLYYAQGMSLAMTRAPLFEGGIVADTRGVASDGLSVHVAAEGADWAMALGTQRRPASDALLGAMRDVHDAFAGWGAYGFSCAMRKERSWGRAREGLSWVDDARPEETQVSIHDHFAWSVESGEDVMADLGIPRDPDGPAWLRPYTIHMCLCYAVGHPLFDQAEAVRLRTAIGFGTVPGDWSGRCSGS